MSLNSWLFPLLFIITCGTMIFSLYGTHYKSLDGISYSIPWTKEKPASEIFVFDSGWDHKAFTLFRETFGALNNHKKTREVRFPIGGLIARVSDLDSYFWDNVEKGTWEAHTYATFMQYITSDTIVVDFGSWIGPTILFSGQLAARTYAIEADPVAFAKASFNLKQNVLTPWYNRVHLQAGCVGVESGPLQMKSAEPGNSEASFHKTVGEQIHRVIVNWTVHCYPLSAILKAWKIDSEIAHVFIKIDVESYECQLIPSLYSWLANMKRRPTLYIAMHKQIIACTNDQYESIAKVAILFRFRSKLFINEKGNVNGLGEFVLSDVIAPD